MRTLEELRKEFLRLHTNSLLNLPVFTPSQEWAAEAAVNYANALREEDQKNANLKSN